MLRQCAVLALLVALFALAKADGAAPDHYGGGSGWKPEGNTYIAQLNGRKQTPTMVDTKATATFVATLDEKYQIITYQFWINGVNGYTMSHIHLGNATTNGPVAVLLLPGLPLGANQTLTSLPMLPPVDICSMVYTGTIKPTTLVNVGAPPISWDDFVMMLKAGNTYVNIHTDAYPAGLIRGQIMLSGKRYSSYGCPSKSMKWYPK